MNWKEFKTLVKTARQESDMLSKQLGRDIFVEFNQDSDCKHKLKRCKGNGIFQINPYAVNLKNGDYKGICLMCGEWTHTNIKSYLEKKSETEE